MLPIDELSPEFIHDNIAIIMHKSIHSDRLRDDTTYKILILETKYATSTNTYFRVHLL